MQKAVDALTVSQTYNCKCWPPGCNISLYPNNELTQPMDQSKNPHLQEHNLNFPSNPPICPAYMCAACPDRPQQPDAQIFSQRTQCSPLSSPNKLTVAGEQVNPSQNPGFKPWTSGCCKKWAQVVWLDLYFNLGHSSVPWLGDFSSWPISPVLTESEKYVGAALRESTLKSLLW